MTGFDINEIIEDIFYSFLQRYREDLEKSIKGSNFVSDFADALHNKCRNLSLQRGGSYTESPKWLKNREAAINRKNNDNECFKYAIWVALNNEKIGKDPRRISKITSFMDPYYWKDKFSHRINRLERS